jgi:hypothetical protein
MSDNTELSEIDYSNRIGMSALRIASSYIDGYSSIKFLYDMLEIQRKDMAKYLTYPEFFNYLHGICYQSAVLNLSNILVNDKDSVNIHYLKSLIEKRISDSQETTSYSNLYTIIQNVVEDYSEKKKGGFYLGLKELRDKYIAHIDKGRFQSATGPNIKISLNDIKLAYDSIGNLVESLIGLLSINPELLDYDQLYKANTQFGLLINNMKENPFNLDM